MDLREEYFVRHGITTPLVAYPDTRPGRHNMLVAKNEEAHSKFRQPRFMVVTMTHDKTDPQHAPVFRFAHQTPIRDSHSNYPHLLRSTWERKVEWDEWEDFVLSWAESNRGSLLPVVGQELRLAAWEMFGYCHDSWLAANLLDRHKDAFHDSFDESIAPEDRVAAIDKVEDFLKARNKNACSSINIFRSYGVEKVHAAWLAKLL